ncbi:MAG: hypothetical protein HY721_24070 [Planctomycetes bacterium]|nr:hypothetical protein [Planctomycetota bacterium]
MAWHRELTVEKWAAYPLETRILMIQNELGRARSSQRTGYYGSTKLALERALELLDLTVEAGLRGDRLGRLLRSRERIARAYLFPEEEIPEAL